MLLAVGAALRLTGWVLRPVRILDARHARHRHRAHASPGSRPPAGPPELRRLARSFNEMADNVEDVLEQQRAFVADASHQLRNPLSALLLRIELLALELPEGNEEIASVRSRGQAPRPGPGRPARPGAGRARRGRPAAHRHRASWPPSGWTPGGRSPRRKGVGLSRHGPVGRHRLGRPGRAVQRPGRGGRQRAEVHAGGRATSTVAVAVRRRDRRRGRRRRRPRPHRGGAGPDRRPLLAQQPAPERLGLGPRPVHLPGAARGGRRAPSPTRPTSRTGCASPITVPRSKP